MPATADPIVDKAITLAKSLTPGEGPDLAVAELTASAGRPDLDRARDQLVRRIHERSDDYDATAALTLVNKALASVPWVDPYQWKHRRKP